MSHRLLEALQESLGSVYAIERELGGAGMSRVFVAIETSLGRRVVIKVLSPEMGESLSTERFRREIMLAANLQHPLVVPLHSAGQASGLPYYTMPFVEGESLRARLERDGKLPLPEAIQLVHDIAEALAYAHSKGVVHRDIKPENVLLTGGHAVVTDFGVAKALVAATASGARGLTSAGIALGTPAYMAPEQAAGDPATDHRADLYALGVIAYELLTGASPFAGRTPHELIRAHMVEAPPAISSRRPDVPAALSSLVMGLLAKAPADRPQTADEVRRALQEASRGITQTTQLQHHLGGWRTTARELVLYAACAFGAVLVARAAGDSVGLPNWVATTVLAIATVAVGALLTSALLPKRRPPSAWRRVASASAVTLGFFGVLVAAYVVLAMLGIGPSGSLLAAGRLEPKERLLVTEFRAPSSDSVLGAVASEAVRTALSQSSAISIVPASSVAAALQQMQRPPGSRLDLALARDVAVREGVRVLVDGSVAPTAGGYVLTLRLISAETGDEVVSYHGTAEGLKEFLPALDDLTRSLRARIGESLKSVRAAPPLDRVTTPSIVALRKFTEARRANAGGDVVRAIELLREAVTIDTAFAMAYKDLGLLLAGTSMPQVQVDSALERAYRYRDRLTERERLLTTAAYFSTGGMSGAIGGGPGRDRQKSTRALQDFLEVDPTHVPAVFELAFIYYNRREYARAESLFLRAIDTTSAGINAYALLGLSQLALGKTTAAESTFTVARRRLPGAVPFSNALEPAILYHRGQLDSLANWLHASRRAADANMRMVGVYLSPDIAALRGRPDEFERLLPEVREYLEAQSPGALAFEASLWRIRLDLWLRDRRERVANELDQVTTTYPIRAMPKVNRPDAYLQVAATYAQAGRIDRARAMLAEYEREVTDSILRRVSQPQLHSALAEIALAEGKTNEALSELAQADSLPDGPVDDCGICFHGLVGRVFDRASMTDSAIAAFERYITTPDPSRFIIGSWWHPRDPLLLAGVRKRLGELYESKGERDKAAAHYTAFLALWKNADPELQPTVAEVRRRLARLTRETRR